MYHILGHRGAVLPEGEVFQNSLAAFKLALEFAEGFETDACLSADGEIFLIHEKYGKRGLAPYLDAKSFALTAGRRLDEMTSSEIKQLKLRCGSSMPTLREAIDLVASYKNKTLNIELKGHNVHHVVIAQLKEAFAQGKLTPQQVMISSFDHAALLKVRQTNPAFKLGALFADELHGTRLIHPHTESKSHYIPVSPQALVAGTVTAINPDYIIVPHTSATVETCAAVAALQSKLKLAVWVVSELQDAHPLAFLEKLKGQPHAEVLDTIMVDDPQGLAQAQL